MPCVCAKRKEAGRQATEKEIEKRKGRDEGGKNKTKAKKQKQKQTRMLKTQTEIQHLAGRAPGEETGPPSCPQDEIGRFFSVVVYEWLAEKLLVREIPFRERPHTHMASCQINRTPKVVLFFFLLL